MESDKYCTIYVVRHGESEFNVKEIMQGQINSPLTENGEGQARERADGLKEVKFDLVYSSDLVRAKRTAEIIALEKAVEVSTREILRERNFGEFEGRPIKEFKIHAEELAEKMQALTEAEKHEWTYGVKGYESNNEIATRMITFLREISVANPGKTILIVSHGSIMRATLMRLGVATYDQLVANDVKNTGYFKLQSDGVDFFVQELHDIDTSKFNFQPQLITNN